MSLFEKNVYIFDFFTFVMHGFFSIFFSVFYNNFRTHFCIFHVSPLLVDILITFLSYSIQSEVLFYGQFINNSVNVQLLLNINMLYLYADVSVRPDLSILVCESTRTLTILYWLFLLITEWLL